MRLLYKYESSFHNEFRVNSQQLLFINFVIFVALVLFFAIGRPKPKQKGPLDLGSNDKNKPPSFDPTAQQGPYQANFGLKEAEAVRPEQAETPVSDPTKVQVLQPEAKKPEVDAKIRDVTPSAAKNQVNVKKNTVYFVFNGHEWEAHEVLGIEYGSKLDTVTEQYQNLIKTSDPSTFEFFEAAYTSLVKSKRR